MTAQMELMSSLLFCALVAHLPQALGEIRSDTRNLDIRFNNSMIIRQAPMQKRVLLNINGPPLVNMVNNIQLVFLDVHCKKCIDCMERAIKAYKTHYHIIKNRPRTEELHEEVLEDLHEKAIRTKREAYASPSPSTKVKRSKAKKKINRSVTVTKYNVDGEVYALKVRESNTNPDREDDNEESTCQVFSVKKTFSCDTPEGDAFLRTVKLKVGKKNKKEKNNKNVPAPTTVKAMFAIPSFRKRQVDNSQVPENFMPSIEEMY